MILLKTLQLNNFLSHEKSEITFGRDDKLLLDGRSGSGKSSVAEAILFGLYGRGRVDNRSLVRRGAKTATVALKLVDGSTETLITRSVSGSGKNALTITQNNGNKGQYLPIARTGLKDQQDWLEKEFLKASYELFTNSVAYPQENENSFVKATATRRKDLLLEIVRAGSFDTYYERAKVALSSNKTDSAILESKMITLGTESDKAEITARTYETFKKEEKEGIIKVADLTTREKSLETKVNDISHFSRQISDNKRIREMLDNSISKIESKLNDLERTIDEHNQVDIAAAHKHVETGRQLAVEASSIGQELKDSSILQQRINEQMSNRPMVFDYTKDIEDINKRLIDLIKQVGKCPAGDKCPFAIPVKGQIDFLTEQLENRTQAGVDEEAAYTKWEKNLASLPKPQDNTKLYNRLQTINANIVTLSKYEQVVTDYEAFGLTLSKINTAKIGLEEERKKNKTELAMIDTQIYEQEQTLTKVDINQLNRDLANVRLSLQQAQKEKNDASIGVAMALQAKETIEASSKKIKNLEKELRKAREDQENLELLKEAFSPRGIKAVVVDYLVPQLEDRINEVLGQMSDFRIRLDTQKATVDDEGIKEGLFITVINDLGEELPFDSYSGGEKVKITVAISEALASLMSGVGFRIMDENIVSLDKESTDGFVSVLVKLQKQFPQLLVISHLQEVKDIFEKSVTITKVNGISKIT